MGSLAETSDGARTGCAVRCSAGAGRWKSKHSTAQQTDLGSTGQVPHTWLGTYLAMIEFSTSTGGELAGAIPSLQQIIALCPSLSCQSSLRFI